MINRDLAKIAQIKDLNVIFFYSLDKNFRFDRKGNLLGLRVSYNDSKLEYDYSSPYFKTFVAKVVEVFLREKDTRNIILLNDLSKELMQDTLLLQDIVEDKEDTIYFQKIPINEFNKRGCSEISKCYMRLVLKNILSIVYGNDDCLVQDLKITGFRGRFVCRATILNEKSLLCEKKQEIEVVFALHDEEINYLSFEILLDKGKCEVAKGEISILDGEFNINWVFSSGYMKASEVFHSKGIHEKCVSFEEVPVIFDNKVEVITKGEKELINFYLGCSGIGKLEEGIKVNDNCFILEKRIDNKVNEASVQHDFYAHVYLSDSLVTVNCFENYGLVKNEGGFVLPIYKKNIVFSFKPLEMVFDRIIMQKMVRNTDFFISDHQCFFDKYSYKVIELQKEFNSLMEVNCQVANCIDLEQSFTKLEDVKRLVKKSEVDV